MAVALKALKSVVRHAILFYSIDYFYARTLNLQFSKMVCLAILTIFSKENSKISSLKCEYFFFDLYRKR